MHDTREFFSELSQPPQEFPVESGSFEQAEEQADQQEGELAIDVYQSGNNVVVEAPIAGVRSEDLDVHVTNDSLMIRGRRHREHTVRDDEYLFQECYWGSFSRSLILPEEVDADRAEASIKNGILRVIMPKLMSSGKKVHVKPQ